MTYLQTRRDASNELCWHKDFTLALPTCRSLEVSLDAGRGAVDSESESQIQQHLRALVCGWKYDLQEYNLSRSILQEPHCLWSHDAPEQTGAQFHNGLLIRSDGRMLVACGVDKLVWIRVDALLVTCFPQFSSFYLRNTCPNDVHVQNHADA